MIYLASPYSGTEAERDERYSQTLKFVTRELQKGFVIFSPIVYGRPFEATIGTAAKDWKKFNETMMNLANTMWVLTLPGWKTSKGVQQEIATWEFLYSKRPVYVSI